MVEEYLQGREESAGDEGEVSEIRDVEAMISEDVDDEFGGKRRKGF